MATIFFHPEDASRWKNDKCDFNFRSSVWAGKMEWTCSSHFPWFEQRSSLSMVWLSLVKTIFKTALAEIWDELNSFLQMICSPKCELILIMGSLTFASTLNGEILSYFLKFSIVFHATSVETFEMHESIINTIESYLLITIQLSFCPQAMGVVSLTVNSHTLLRTVIFERASSEWVIACNR